MYLKCFFLVDTGKSIIILKYTSDKIGEESNDGIILTWQFLGCKRWIIEVNQTEFPDFWSGHWHLTNLVMKAGRNKLLSIIKTVPRIFLIETIYIQCN